jgi:hypothetical protein
VRKGEQIMAKENNPKQIAGAMENIAKGQGNEELMFNPSTGTLEVKRPNETVDRDAVPATEFAREGFFI